MLLKTIKAPIMVVLDERGKDLSTVGFAQWMDRTRQAAQDVAFVVGGDEGLHQSVRERAALVLRLSHFTLPHRLARVLLVEQLYRAMTILAGEPYHK